MNLCWVVFSVGHSQIIQARVAALGKDLGQLVASFSVCGGGYSHNGVIGKSLSARGLL